MAEFKKLPRFVSPKGTAKYPWLNKADTKFNADGEYKVTVVFPDAELDKPIKHKHEDFNGRTLRDILDAGATAAYDEELAKAKPADKKKLQRVDPYTAEVDDEGNETGNSQLSFKMKANVKPKTGKPFSQKPELLDAQRNKVNVAVFGGSTIKVIFECIPYFVAGSKMAGVTLRLKAVQILALAERSGGYGDDFDDEEGFVGGSTGDDDDGDPGNMGDDDGAPTGEGW